MGTRWDFLFPEGERTQEVLIVCALTLIAVATRAYGIWEWPLTGDEYFTVTYAEERATGVVGPAYYALVLSSQAIFGATNWAARLPSVILGVLSTPAFYLMGRAIFGRRTAAIGCIFVILSEWHLYHSQLARFYSGVFLFGAISYHAYYVSLRNGSYLYLLVFFVSSLIATLFHATGIFIVVSCGAYSLFYVLRSRKEKNNLSKSIAKTHLLICIAIAVISLPKFLDIAGAWLENPRGKTTNSLRAMLGIVENMGVVVFVSAFMGLISIYFINKDKFYLLSILIFIPLFLVSVFSVIMPPSRPRYMFFSLPLFFALSARLCSSIEGNMNRYIGFDMGTAVVISSVMFVSFVSYYSGKLSLDARDPARFVEGRYEGGDQVVVFEYPIREYFDDETNVEKITMQAWRGGLVPVTKKNRRTWIIFKTYRTASLSRDFESWLMENASLKWRKEETRFDYTQRGYEVWLESDQ